MKHAPLFEVLRGQVVESLHFGSVAVADARGKLMAWAGDPYGTTYMRSSAKPFQALPLVLTGAMDAHGLDLEELAIICASHSGTDDQVRVVRSIQKKAGLREDDLQCGAAFPSHEATRQRMRLDGAAPAPNRHNCSGKHSGMLTLARHLDAPLTGYLGEGHPVQELILEAMARMTGMHAMDIQVGVDGCSAPNFALPLISAATAYARLADPEALDEQIGGACHRVSRAMREHPHMVGGPARFDTELMTAAGDRLIAKGGAEGFQGIGIFPGGSSLAPGGLGVAIKISDGDPRKRSGAPVTLSALEQIGGVSAGALGELAHYLDRPALNDRGLVVGRGQVTFELTRETEER
jgi:L-asparaginase II